MLRLRLQVVQALTVQRLNRHQKVIVWRWRYINTFRIERCNIQEDWFSRRSMKVRILYLQWDWLAFIVVTRTQKKIIENISWHYEPCQQVVLPVGGWPPDETSHHDFYVRRLQPCYSQAPGWVARGSPGQGLHQSLPHKTLWNTLAQGLVGISTNCQHQRAPLQEVQRGR